MVDAVLPAAGAMKQRGQEPILKALLVVNGSQLIHRAVSSLRGSGLVDRIVVVGPTELQACALEAGATVALQPAGGGAENMLAGLDWLNENGQCERPVAIMAADLPYVKPETIKSFVASIPTGPDIVVPLVHRHDFVTRYAGAPASFVRLAEGSFALTGLYVVNPMVVRQQRTVLRKLFQSRKSQWKTARMVGLGHAYRLLRGNLSVQDISEVVKRTFGCTAEALIGVDPSLAFDIDDLRDLKWCETAGAANGELL